jgi:exosortase
MDDGMKVYILPACLALLFFCVFSPVWRGLVAAWSGSDDYSHGFLIVPLVLYIIWQKRAEYLNIQWETSRPMLAAVIASLLLYLLAYHGEIKTLASLAMVMFMAASVYYLGGGKVFRLSLFPLLLLLFMIPVPAQIYAAMTVPLQLFVTKTTAAISSAMSIPLLREGNVIILPEHRLQVVQACSGLRSVMSLLTLGAVIGYFGLRSRPLQWLLFFLAIPIAIFVNIIRVFSMVIAFYYFDFDLTLGSIHTFFGVLIFVFAILLFLFFRKGLSWCEK